MSAPAITTKHKTVQPELIEELRDLVRALDRRVPHLERTGELDIARDAAALKDAALLRLAKLESLGND
jgi:hypothetical protein